MKRSRSGQCGSVGSNFRNFWNSTVATSAMPIGMPGWPESACCTASMARALMAFARSRGAAACSVIFSRGTGGFLNGAQHDGDPNFRQCAKARATANILRRWTVPNAKMLTANKRSTYPRAMQQTEPGGLLRSAGGEAMSKASSAKDRVDSALSRLESMVDERLRLEHERSTGLEQRLARLEKQH